MSKTNGKNTSVQEPEEQTAFDALRLPTSPVPGPEYVVKNRKSKWWKFYTSINWAEWWDEFNGEITKDGRLRYKTAYAFAKAKSKNKVETELIYEMIGPKPVPQQGGALRVPWLGDWYKRRSLGFWSLEDSEKVQSIQKALAERENSLEALQAISPLTLEQVMRWTRLAQQVDEMFGGRALLPEKPPTDDENITRFNLYVEMQTKIMSRQNEAIKNWQKTHGVPEMDVEHWIKMMSMMAAKGGVLGAILANQMNPGGSAATVIQGNLPSNEQQLGATPLGNITPSHLLMAQSMMTKAQMYNLNLPKTLDADEQPKAKSNGSAEKVTHQ